MKFLKIEYWTNEESGRMGVRPTKVIAYKSFGNKSKLLIEGFPHWIAVDKPVEELERELQNATIRSKMPRRTPQNGDSKINTRTDAGGEVSSVQESYDSRLFVQKN